MLGPRPTENTTALASQASLLPPVAAALLRSLESLNPLREIRHIEPWAIHQRQRHAGDAMVRNQLINNMVWNSE